MEQANSFSQNTELRQEQTLAPQQILSLEFLMAPVMELEEKVELELSSNPVLELDEKREEPSSGEADDPYADLPALPQTPDLRPDADESHMLDSNREDFEEHLDKIAETPEAWDAFSHDDPPDTSQQSKYSAEEEERRNYIFDSIVAETSLQEYLLDQLRFADEPQKVADAAEYMIGSLDETGYLKTPAAEIAQSVNCTLDEAEQALALVQSFEPPGIAARDLKECLLLQLKAAGSQNQDLIRLIKNHLDDLAHNRLPLIAKKMNITLDHLNELIEELRLLNPHPGNAVTPSTPLYVVPEVIVEKDGDSFRIVQNDPFSGRLSISDRYMKMLEDPAVSPEDKAYIRSKIADGKLLIHNIDQRKSTIRRIAELIVSTQYDFMKYGAKALKPMTMQQAADKLGLHETTISRAVANKYMQTPVGLFEFKFFFSGGFQSEEGEEVSSHAIKDMIQELVSKEDPAKPLSDSKLSKLLKERGFNVARRTVAKYRDELSIQSSQMRKAY